MINHKLPFKIGCDPEFVLEGTVQKVMAEQVKTLIDFERQTIHGEIGVDGSGYQVELRPKPTRHIPQLLGRIKAMLFGMSKQLGQFEWKTTSFQFPAGGHIHLQIPARIYDDTDKLENITLGQFMFYLPILLSEDPQNVEARREEGYGKYTDEPYREGEHETDGGQTSFTIEFRSPTAEWLTTPKIAAATLAYIATIHNELLNHPAHIKQFKELYMKRDELIETLEDINESRSPMFTKPLMKRIHQAVSTFELYPAFKKEIMYIMDSKKVLEDKRKVNFDILKGWKIETPKPTVEQLKHERYIKSKIAKMDEREYDHNTAIYQLFSYNEDYKIQEFVQELTKRIHAFAWKLENKYVFFGLRKGYNEVIVANSKSEVLMGPKNLLTDQELRTKASTALKKMIKRFKQENAYFIGIPYELRRGAKALEHFIDLIHFLENKLPKNKTKLTILTDLSKVEIDFALAKEKEPERKI